jgi:hypothetical protein
MVLLYQITMHNIRRKKNEVLDRQTVYEKKKKI